MVMYCMYLGFSTADNVSHLMTGNHGPTGSGGLLTFHRVLTARYCRNHRHHSQAQHTHNTASLVMLAAKSCHKPFTTSCTKKHNIVT